MGAVWLVRRAAIDEVGPADESFFLFSEEVDWAFRFRQAGWKSLFFPGAGATHVYGASHQGRLFIENQRGHLRFLAKHRGAAYAERARVLLRLSLRLRGARRSAASGAATYREAAAWLGSGSRRRSDRMRAAAGAGPAARVAAARHRATPARARRRPLAAARRRDARPASFPGGSWRARSGSVAPRVHSHGRARSSRRRSRSRSPSMRRST